MHTNKYRYLILINCFLLMVLFPSLTLWGESDIVFSKGQSVYVAIYSHIYYGDRGKPFNLAATLSMRNTDPSYPITVLSAKYYDSKGALVKEYVKTPIKINPMASDYIYVKESDITGGSGANFVVKWESENMVNDPVIEGVMIGASSGQGISFITSGKIIKEHD